MKYARHAGPHASPAPSTRTSARSRRIRPSSTSPRSRRSSPSAGRSSSKGRATSTSGSDCSDGACTGLFYSRRIGRAPQGRRRSAERRHHLHRRAGADDDSRRGEADGPHRQVLDRRDAGVHAGAETARVLTATSSRSSRSSRRPATPWAASAASSRTSRRSAFMVTSTNRTLAAALTFLPDRALTGGIDWDLRFKTRYALTGYWAGSDVHGSTRRDRALQENSRHYFQRPDLRQRDARSDAHVAHRHGRLDRRSARSAASASASTRTCRSRARLRHQRRRLHAPRRSAERQQLAAVPQRQAEPLVPQPEHQFQPVRGVELRRRSSVLRRQRQRRRDVRQQLEHRRRRQHHRRSASTIARRAAARASTSEGSTEGWFWLNTDNRRALSLEPFHGRRPQRRRRVVVRVLAERHLSPDARRSRSTPASATRRTSTTRSG